MGARLSRERACPPRRGRMSCPGPTTAAAGWLEDAAEDHRDGQLEAAEAQYLRVLRAFGVDVSSGLCPTTLPICPIVAEALHLLGALRLQRRTLADDEDGDAGRAPAPAPAPQLAWCPAEVLAAVSLLRGALAALPPGSPEKRARLLGTLGNALLRLPTAKDAAEAVSVLRQGIALDSGRCSVWFTLSRALARLKKLKELEGCEDDSRGLVEERAEVLQKLVDMDPDHPEALYRLGMVLMNLRRGDEALRPLERYLDLARKHAAADQAPRPGTRPWKTETVSHWVAAARGGTTAAAPADYVARLFDSYAETFDTHMVRHLDNHTPEFIVEQICSAIAGRAAGCLSLRRCADLGCGTGVMAPLLHELGIDKVVGVDLSAKMLNKAREKGGYEQLICGGLLDIFDRKHFHTEGGNIFDVVVAADVFVYVGDLEPVLRAAAHSLAGSHGLVVFSTEAPPRSGGANEGIAPVPAGGYRLAPTGRYVHSAAYVRQTAEACGLALKSRKAAVLRYDGGKPVHGHVHVLRPAVT